MKKLVVILLIIPIVSIGQTFEITNGQTMCMIGKGKGQDATINPYADEDYSYALIENIGLAEFQIRVESTTKDFKQFLLKPSNKTVIKLYRNNILYLDALTLEKVDLVNKAKGIKLEDYSTLTKLNSNEFSVVSVELIRIPEYDEYVSSILK